MSIAVKDIRNHKITTTYFSNPKATLPVKMKDGFIQYVKWGRRIHEQYLYYIQGVAATDKQETRVYIVAIKTDVESNYARWPRILASKAVSEK